MSEAILAAKGLLAVVEAMLQAVIAYGGDVASHFDTLTKGRHAARLGGVGRVMSGRGNATHFLCKGNEIYELLGHDVLSVTFDIGGGSYITVRPGDLAFDRNCEDPHQRNQQFMVCHIYNPWFGSGTEFVDVMQCWNGHRKPLKKKELDWTVALTLEMARLLDNAVAFSHVQPVGQQCPTSWIVARKALRLTTGMDPTVGTHFESCARCRRAEQFLRSELDRRQSLVNQRWHDANNPVAPEHNEITQQVQVCEIIATAPDDAVSTINWLTLKAIEASFLYEALVSEGAVGIHIHPVTFMDQDCLLQYGYRLSWNDSQPPDGVDRLAQENFVIIIGFPGSPADRLLRTLLKCGAVSTICR